MHKEQIHLEDNTLRFSHIGRDWLVLRADMEKLWEKMVDDTLTPKTNPCEKHSYDKNSCDKDERLPYWAELWPSSLALAKCLEQNKKDIEQKVCMDLGCGLGFTALCGAYLGAFVVGVDYEADAIMLAKENAEANDFKVIDFSCFHKNIYRNEDIIDKNQINFSHESPTNKTDTRAMLNTLNTSNVFNEDSGYSEHFGNCLDFRVMDWRAPCITKHSLDFVWAADIVYERAFVEPILDFLEYALKDTGKAWIAEPGRAIFEHFPKMLKNTSLKMQMLSSQETEALSAHIPKAHVNIWEITRCHA